MSITHSVELKNGLSFDFTLTPEELRVSERSTGLEESVQNVTGEVGPISTVCVDGEMIVTVNGHEAMTIVTARIEHDEDDEDDVELPSFLEDILIASIVADLPLSPRQLRKMRDMIDQKLADEDD